jgi:hypothetical protein
VQPDHASGRRARAAEVGGTPGFMPGIKGERSLLKID